MIGIIATLASILVRSSLNDVIVCRMRVEVQVRLGLVEAAIPHYPRGCGSWRKLGHHSLFGIVTISHPCTTFDIMTEVSVEHGPASGPAHTAISHIVRRALPWQAASTR